MWLQDFLKKSQLPSSTPKIELSVRLTRLHVVITKKSKSKAPQL